VRSFVAGVAAAVVASAVLYFVLAATEALSSPVRLAVMALVLVLGIAMAWKASRETYDPGAVGIAVGDRIDSAGDVTVERVDVQQAGNSTRVGTNVKSGGAVRVSDVRVTHREDSE
jgi:hypothetical protein